MAKVNRPCPNCQYMLAIPQPMPERYPCPKCGAVMKRRSSAPTPAAAGIQPANQARRAAVAPPPAAPVSAPAATGLIAPKTQLMLLGGFCALLFCSICVVLLLLFNGKGPDNTLADKPGEKEGSGPQGGSGDKSNPSNPSNPDDPSDAKISAAEEEKRQQTVKPHIEKGRDYLIKRIQEMRDKEKADGTILFWGPDWEREQGFAGGPGGVIALLGLTLLECGVPADDSDIAWLAGQIEKDHAKLRRTHGAATALMFLSRWHEGKALEPKTRQVLQTLALRLIGAQLDSGAWWSDLTVGQENEVLKALKAGKFTPDKKGSGTASNTFFAVQGLWMARSHVNVRDSLLAAGGYFQRTQLNNGSWTFSDMASDKFFATSTIAGLIALGMEKALLDGNPRVPFIPEEKLADPAKAFAFVAKSVGDKGDRATFVEQKEMFVGKLFGADAYGDIYYLWALEQLGTVYGKHILGEDWYDWGYKELLKAQNKEDGSWADQHGQLADTCFALLFLKKSNLFPDLTRKLRELRAR